MLALQSKNVDLPGVLKISSSIKLLDVIVNVNITCSIMWRQC